MRNSIVFKMIAIALCALSLLGAVGSAVGIFVLSETGLYNKTVDQMIEDRIQTEGASIARGIAGRYASTTLGACPERMTYEHFPNHGGFFSGYGYEILDEDGTVLVSENIPEAATAHSFPVTGQYMHLVSLQSEQERYPNLAADPATYTNAMLVGDAYVYSVVPPEGALVTGIAFELADSSSHDYMPGSAMGSLHYTPDGQLVCLFTNFHFDVPQRSLVTYVRMHNERQELIYEASAPEGAGYFTYTDSGRTLMYVSTLNLDAQAPEETVEPTQETVPETIPETTTETVAVETTAATEESHAAQETTEAAETTSETAEATEAAAETTEATVASSASAYPEETTAGTEETQVAETTETVPATQPATEPQTAEASATEPAETIPEAEAAEPVLINGRPLMEYDVNSTEYFDYDTQQRMYAQYVYVPMPEYTVKLYLTEDSLIFSDSYQVLEILRTYRQYLLPVMGACILVFIICAVYLCCAAGRRPKSDEIRPDGLNRLPLDLYLGLDCLAIPCLLIGAVEGGNYFLQQNLILGASCAFGCGLAASVLAVGFLFACAAQLKMPEHYWIKNSLCGRFIRWFMKFAVWFEKFLAAKLFPLCGRLIKVLWRFCVRAVLWTYRTTEKVLLRTGNLLGRVFRSLSARTHRFLSLLPVTWQWLILGSAMILMLFITVAGRFDFGIVVSIIFAFGLVIYSAHCFGILWESTRKMGKGDLESKVDDRLMLGAFKEFAADLNDLAGVAAVAAQKQLKSERMKTELITNVSHDIKTPLTSIINYVDLLQKPHTEEEEQQYLEVLDRQSQRLKKLIEDLMDMSKASTGNMSVEITQVDAVESVNQALGEFADKLDRAQLIPVFRHTDDSVKMMADGRLVWRVLSNLLGNAVKYAMPGTRLYVDLSQMEDQVVISLKNISREELNVAADELMERFVRGDDSRNTEGSGLGLNIAKSLMELQKGQLQLLVDGDLFKVTLIFPRA